MSEREPGTVTILYVDDEEMACKYFARTFGTDYKILTAASVDEALEILKDAYGEIDIVVTDYQMPERVGSELLRQIERHYQHIIRILVTAYADKDMLLDTVNAGEIFRILEKPLDVTEVRYALRLASELSRQRSLKQQALMAIDETLAFLAHELNTPLSAIVNFSQNIQQSTHATINPAHETQLSEIGRTALLISNNARYCISILSIFVHSVQNANTVSSTHSEISSTAGQLIASLLDTYPLYPEQKALIKTDIKEDFRILVLPNCVALVLSSLLSNGLRALDGRPNPQLCLTVLIEGHPQIRLADNGPGISPQIIEHIQSDPINSYIDTGSTGWCMIFCKRIMQSFGGNLTIQSLPDQSTVVTIHFPLVKNKIIRSEG